MSGTGPVGTAETAGLAAAARARARARALRAGGGARARAARGRGRRGRPGRRSPTRAGSPRPASKFVPDRRRSRCWRVSSSSSRAPACRPSRRSPRLRARAASRSGARSSSATGCSTATRCSASPARTGRRRRPSCSARSCARPGGRVEVAGNVGRPLTDVAEHIEPGPSVVCELSSFQLEDVHELALRRRGAAQPRARPPRPARHVRGVPRREAAHLRARAREDRAARAWGSTASSSPPTIRLPAEPRIPGVHNRENAAAATAAARAAGVGDDAIAEALTTFPGVPHRLELVRELRGVRYVNDSKATNTAAARRGVAAYDRAAPADPRRLAQGRGLRAVRARPAGERALDLPDRRGGGRARRRARRGRDDRTRATATSSTRSRTRPPTPSPATSSCSRRPAASFDQFDNFEAARRRVPAARRGAPVSPRKKQRTLEWQLLVLVPLALTAFGLVMVYSATSASAALGNGNPVGYLERQAVYALLGIALMICAARTDFRKLRHARARPRRRRARALPRRARDRPARSTARAAGSASGPPRSSRRSSRSSRSSSGSPRTSRASRRRGR